MNTSKFQLRPVTRFAAMGREHVVIDLLGAKASVVDKEPSAHPTVTWQAHAAVITCNSVRAALPTSRFDRHRAVSLRLFAPDSQSFTE